LLAGYTPAQLPNLYHGCFRAWASAGVLDQLCPALFERALFPILCFLASQCQWFLDRPAVFSASQ
jgi:hypothetical protein